MFSCHKCAKKFTTEHGLTIHLQHCNDLLKENNPICKSKKKYFIFLLSAIVCILLINTVAIFKINEKLEGLVPPKGKLILIKPTNCPQCQDLEAIKKTIQSQDLEIIKESEIISSDNKSQELIKKFEIKKLPALIFESERKIKTSLRQVFEKDSRVVGKTAFIWEQNLPPYFDLTTKKVTGLVDVVFLTNKNCSDCYDVVKTQKPILESFGIKFASEKMIDVASPEGQNLIKKYSIKAAPTIILSKEASAYPQLTQVWQQIGTIEPDGNFVFRKIEVLQVKYENLEEVSK